MINPQKEKGGYRYTAQNQHYYSANHNKEVDTTGLLTDQQLADLGAIKLELYRIEDIVKNIATLSIESSLHIRNIPELPLTLAHNDIAKIAKAHELAENRVRDAAFDLATRGRV